MDTPLGLIPTLSILVSFAAIFFGVNKIIADKKKKQHQEVPLQQSSASPSSPTTANVDADILPIITAAVYATVAENVVIRKITFAHDVRETSWSYLARAKSLYTRDNIQKTRTIYGK